MAELVPLRQMISALEYGTKLHISVWFFIPAENDLLALGPEQIMHTAPFCKAAKARPGGYSRCIRCKKWANEKAIRTRRPFCGFCIHGIYEACVPVEYQEKIAAVVYCGNSVPDPDRFREKNLPYSVEEYLDTVDCSATPDRCLKTAESVASYLQLLLSHVPSSAPDRSGYLVRNLKQYAKNNYLYQIRLSDLGEIFHYHEKYLGRVFKGDTGISFNRYVNDLRLDHACGLLRRTSAEILEIALSSGFDSVPYFNRLFKQRYGKTPGEYRKAFLDSVL